MVVLAGPNGVDPKGLNCKRNYGIILDSEALVHKRQHMYYFQP